MKLLVFTYAPAGLGHLRVTDALVDSRPKGYSYVMLGSYDKFITKIHRIFSTNWLAKWIFTFSQYGLIEVFGSFIYRMILIATSGSIYVQLKDLIERKKDVDEIWIIATHFGMAHQIGYIKEKLIKETGKKVRLIVQVTDDTTQRIWCISGTDVIFVPSLETKNKLAKYAKQMKMHIEFEVIPYPLCPVFTKKISPAVEKRQSVFLTDKNLINVAVPISGAAVGLRFVMNLIKTMQGKSSRFQFWVVVKKSVYTELFLNSLAKINNVHLVVGRNDNEMISLYEMLYQNNLIHLEITKPSEQSFKAILTPNLVGGSLILLTSAVGRQEYENISFLSRQGLLPGLEDNIPRAIRLPKDPAMACDFILWGLDSGLYKKMSSDEFSFSKKMLDSNEVGPEGSEMFWEIVQKKFS